MSDSAFDYDVFLSHSTLDKLLVRKIALFLKSKGIKVWFDDWMIKPGDNIPAKIEEGLERSRVMLLCISKNALNSDWATLESGTFRFRDPLNKERRFVPLRLDDAAIKGSLAQYRFISWQSSKRKGANVELLEACYVHEESIDTSKTANEPLQNASPLLQGRNLQIQVSPTREGLRQLAHFRVLNVGERPILIDSWFVEWNDRSGTRGFQCYRGTLPIRLNDHERADFVININEKPVDELRSLGVFDAEKHYWPAAESEILRFKHVAQLHSPPKPPHEENSPKEPSNVSIVVVATDSGRDGSKRLEVRLKNLGPADLVPRSAEVEWEFDPPRWMPKEEGKPLVGESSGRMSMQRLGPNTPLSINEEAIFFLDACDPFSQPIVSALADDVPDRNLRVYVSASKWQWTAHSDEVPGAIRDFALAVVKQLYVDQS